MSEIIEGKMSIPFTITKGHNVINYEPEKMIDKTQFHYKAGFLDKIEFIHSQFTEFRDYQYYQDMKDKSISYIKLLDRDSYSNSTQEFIICFNNNKIKYVTMAFNSVLEDIYLFTYNGNNILVKEFNRRLNKNEYYLNIKNEIIFGRNSEIENIIRTIGLSKKSPRKIIDYYQYNYLQNKLVGFSIFEAKTDKFDVSTQDELDYQLSEAYILLN